jgi:hypothetical protein
VREPRLVERLPDRAHAAVHHVGRRDHVGARARMRQRLGGEHGQRGVVVDLVPAQHAAVPVVGVLAEAHVGDEHEAGGGAANRLQRPRHDAVGAGRTAAARILALRDAEEEDRGYPEIGQAAALLRRPIDGQLGHARHRVDRLLDAPARHDEQRLHELFDRDTRLAHEAPERLAPPQAPRAVSGIATHPTSSLSRSPAALQKCSTTAAASAPAV